MKQADALERGREHVAERQWAQAYEALRQADGEAGLDAADLWLLATTAYMTGREDEFVAVVERAHQRHFDAGENLRAARCAVWIGIVLTLRGEVGPASGWFGRARRLVEQSHTDCAERGWLLLPEVLGHVQDTRWSEATDAAAAAAEIAERFHDRDLFALAVHEQGHALVRRGRPAEGFALLDEAMVAAISGELSPVVTGLVYCGVIAYCQQLHDVRRAGEWTAALTRWCGSQPQMVAYTGQCLVHRAEVLQVQGAWSDALEEARRAADRFGAAGRPWLVGEAHYRVGELYRLRGELDDAEAAYREASQLGFPPQPGLAVLRLTQEDVRGATASIRRALVEVSEPLDRAPLLFAAVQILLAGHDREAARDASRELNEIAAHHDSALLAAWGGEARGAVALADGETAAALVSLRQAWQRWRDLGAPYEAARVRVLVGLSCRDLGDDDAARLELEAARGVFAELGAKTDLAHVDGLLAGPKTRVDRLTPREMEVLRMIAAGQTNKRIAAELVLSERTIDRHVSNILTKLNVASRAGATAYAYEHGLL